MSKKFRETAEKEDGGGVSATATEKGADERTDGSEEPSRGASAEGDKSPELDSSESKSFFFRFLAKSPEEREIATSSILRNGKWPALDGEDEDADDEDDAEDEIMITARMVRQRWVDFLECYVPCDQWMAVCRSLTRERGVKVYADVTAISYDDLTVDAILIDATDPDTYEGGSETTETLSIFDLTPVAEDGNTQICEAVDHLQFFYENIWWPWDNDDDEEKDWPSQHLAFRFQLFSDFSEVGNRCYSWVRFKALATRYRDLQTEMDNIKNTPELSEDEIAAAMFEIKTRQREIRRETQMIENPSLRMAVELHRQKARRWHRRPGVSLNVVVKPGISLPQLVSYLQEVESITEDTVSDSQVKVFDCLETAVEESVMGDIVVVPSGSRFQIQDLGELVHGGGQLVAIGDEEAIIGVMADYEDQQKAKLMLNKVVVKFNICDY